MQDERGISPERLLVVDFRVIGEVDGRAGQRKLRGLVRAPIAPCVARTVRHEEDCAERLRCVAATRPTPVDDVGDGAQRLADRSIASRSAGRKPKAEVGEPEEDPIPAAAAEGVPLGELRFGKLSFLAQPLGLLPQPLHFRRGGRRHRLAAARAPRDATSATARIRVRPLRPSPAT